MKGTVKDNLPHPRDGASFLIRDSEPILDTTTPLFLRRYRSVLHVAFASSSELRKNSVEISSYQDMEQKAVSGELASALVLTYNMSVMV
jgi:hypothetical protein